MVFRVYFLCAALERKAQAPPWQALLKPLVMPYVVFNHAWYCSSSIFTSAADFSEFFAGLHFIWLGYSAQAKISRKSCFAAFTYPEGSEVFFVTELQDCQIDPVSPCLVRFGSVSFKTGENFLGLSFWKYLADFFKYGASF
jgi:hypothetical protein